MTRAHFHPIKAQNWSHGSKFPHGGTHRPLCLRAPNLDTTCFSKVKDDRSCWWVASAWFSVEELGGFLHIWGQCTIRSVEHICKVCDENPEQEVFFFLAETSWVFLLKLLHTWAWFILACNILNHQRTLQLQIVSIFPLWLCPPNFLEQVSLFRLWKIKTTPQED